MQKKVKNYRKDFSFKVMLRTSGTNKFSGILIHF